MKFNDSWCNKFKFIQKATKGEGFAWCTLCESNFSVVHGGENDINRYTSKHKVYVDAAQQEMKLTDLGASSATTNLDSAWNAFFWFSGWTQPPLENCKSRC